ncbi:hypothetical protein scyTo_0014518 [Scyliorhinus torazame]|uniref:Coiled-coil domain-containing protein 61 n=1 Tax=Scyliorhinus torazame TaxID=75743 RepID=A0A401NP70_SCYTO|nr:hypothetical protein [Scyliorhinus torazame]
MGPSPQNRSSLNLGSGGRHSQTRADSDSHPASRERNKQWSGPRERERSTSRERSGRWATFRERERSSSRESQQGNRCRVLRLSPSPTGTRQPRFDPTAYVHSKEQKQKEMEQRKLQRSRKPKRPLGLAAWSSPNLPQRKPKPRKHLASTPTKQNKENYLDSCDLSEIDARLNALQEYMEKLGARAE